MNCRNAIVAIRFGVWILVCAVGAIPIVARAQYPEKPITILVGYDVDSVGDQVARGLAEAATKHLLKPILGSRLIKSTIQGLRRDRQRPSSFAPACHSVLQRA